MDLYISMALRRSKGESRACFTFAIQMHLKDYYQILGIEPSATIAEIKQAYRRLALLHHPDKNGDHSSTAVFSEIKEAYEVLTNPAKKEQYLQKRWYNQSIGRKKTQTIVTPVTILKEALELERYVSKLDVHRFDRQGLFEYMMAGLNNSTIEKLKASNEPDIDDQIIFAYLEASKILGLDQAQAVAERLSQFANNESKEKIVDFIRKKRKKEKSESRELLWVILITLLLCVLIWRSV